jgi:hypothetical protein
VQLLTGVCYRVVWLHLYENCAIPGYYVASDNTEDPSPLKMGLIGCPETSVRNYHYSLHNYPKEGSSKLLHGRNLKSRIRITLHWTGVSIVAFINLK